MLERRACQTGRGHEGGDQITIWYNPPPVLQRASPQDSSRTQTGKRSRSVRAKGAACRKPHAFKARLKAYFEQPAENATLPVPLACGTICNPCISTPVLWIERQYRYNTGMITAHGANAKRRRGRKGGVFTTRTERWGVYDVCQLWQRRFCLTCHGRGETESGRCTKLAQTLCVGERGNRLVAPVVKRSQVSPPFDVLYMPPLPD